MKELSLGEASRQLGVTERWTRRHLLAGDITARKLPNGRWRVPESSLPEMRALRERLRTYPVDGPRPACGRNGCERPVVANGLCHRDRTRAYRALRAQS